LKSKEIKRCEWHGTDPLYVTYHDKVWGTPEYDSRSLFAKLILDGAQAGLSWITILRKEQNYFDAFDGLDPYIMAHYNEDKFEELMQNAGIVRNKLKIRSAISNAQHYVRMQEEGIDFSEFLWSFVDGRPKINKFKSPSELPAFTADSDAMSKALKKEGFKFVGSTICYAFMQAVGMVNDHVITCFRWKEVQRK
jgi:DNA-3-methyladenine glycosylase I